MFIGDRAEEDVGRGRLMAIPGIRERRVGWLAAMQETL
jgi:hypothetical protein